jgi:DNA gyrase inhibitor GyrI
MKNRKTLTALFILAVASLWAQEPATPAAPDSSVQVKVTQPFFYAAVEMKGSYNQHSAGFNTLFGELGKQGLGMNAPFGIYYNNPKTTPEADLKWELGVAFQDSTPVQAPLKLKKWPFIQTASLVFEGSYSNLGPVYVKLYGWIGANGYIPEGPTVEKFLNAPTQNEKGESIGKVEIIVPISKRPK